jgi:hypothetical protein
MTEYGGHIASPSRAWVAQYVQWAVSGMHQPSLLVGEFGV